MMKNKIQNISKTIGDEIRNDYKKAREAAKRMGEAIREDYRRSLKIKRVLLSLL